MTASKRIAIYTDGSSLGNPGPGGWSWWRHGNCWAAGSLPHTTNQQAELVAVLMALKTIPADVALKIVSDSQYTVNMLTKWLPGWKRAGWRTASGQPVANLKIVQHLDAALSKRLVVPQFEWVRGHTGVIGNEEADRAAVAAAYAEKSGRLARKGPGWSTRPAPAAPRTKQAPPPAGKKTSRATDRGKTPGSVRSDGALMGVRPTDGLSVMKCTSCGATVNPLSLDCRCTR